MGNNQTIKKINYEDIQNILSNKNTILYTSLYQTSSEKDNIHPTNSKYILINTLGIHEQDCLILNTLNANNETDIINHYLSTNRNINIIVYGKNVNDETVTKKCQQLNSLGFYNIFVYLGGLFEWLLLQDIYGDELFPTNIKITDILKYKSPSILNRQLLEYY
jgi:hypothetical protein